MPPRSVSQGVPDSVDAFLSQDLHEAGEAVSLDLFQTFEVRRGVLMACDLAKTPRGFVDAKADRG